MQTTTTAPLQNFERSRRTYTEHGTGKSYPMYSNTYTHEVLLVSEDRSEIVSNFYACAHTDTDLKLNTGEIVSMKAGEFFRQSKDRHVVATKYFMQKRFRKL
jgi:hypothetical protein